MSERAKKTRAIAVLVTAVAFTAGSSFTPAFGGFDPADFPNPIADLQLTPAGYAFAIWGPIFLALIGSGIFGVLKRAEDAVWDATRLPLFLCQILGAGWVGLAIIAPLWATVVIWVMLALALIAYARACKSADLWPLRVPLGLLAGWLTAASWVALATSGTGFIEGLSPATSSWIGLIGALILALAILHRFGGLAYAVAVIWALIGIVMANLGLNPAFVAGAAAGAVLIAVYAGMGFKRA